MKIIRTKLVPSGYKGINVFGFLFVRPKTNLTDIDINHEAIHSAQIKEMLYIFFYIWYGIEYVIRFLLYYKSSPYRQIAFEVEAYDNQNDKDYLENRKHFSWFKYL